MAHVRITVYKCCTVFTDWWNYPDHHFCHYFAVCPARQCRSSQCGSGFTAFSLCSVSFTAFERSTGFDHTELGLYRGSYRQPFYIRNLNDLAFIQALCPIKRASDEALFIIESLGLIQTGFQYIKQIICNGGTKLGINFTDTGWTGDVNFSDIVANHIQTNKYQTFFSEIRTYLRCNGSIILS